MKARSTGRRKEGIRKERKIRKDRRQKEQKNCITRKKGKGMAE